MKQTIEVPDLILTGNTSHSDELEIIISRARITFRASVDGTGAEFICSKEQLKRLLE